MKYIGPYFYKINCQCCHRQRHQIKVICFRYSIFSREMSFSYNYLRQWMYGISFRFDTTVYPKLLKLNSQLLKRLIKTMCILCIITLIKDNTTWSTILTIPVIAQYSNLLIVWYNISLMAILMLRLLCDFRKAFLASKPKGAIK